MSEAPGEVNDADFDQNEYQISNNLFKKLESVPPENGQKLLGDPLLSSVELVGYNDYILYLQELNNLLMQNPVYKGYYTNLSEYRGEHIFARKEETRLRWTVQAIFREIQKVIIDEDGLRSHLKKQDKLAKNNPNPSDKRPFVIYTHISTLYTYSDVYNTVIQDDLSQILSSLHSNHTDIDSQLQYVPLSICLFYLQTFEKYFSFKCVQNDNSMTTNLLKSYYIKLQNLRAKLHEGRCQRITNILTGNSGAILNRQSGYATAYTKYKQSNETIEGHRVKNACSHFWNPVGGLRCQSMLRTRKQYDEWYGSDDKCNVIKGGGRRKKRTMRRQRYGGACSDHVAFSAFVGGLWFSLVAIDATLAGATVVTSGAAASVGVVSWVLIVLYHVFVVNMTAGYYWIMFGSKSNNLNKNEDEIVIGYYIFDGSAYARVDSITESGNQSFEKKINNSIEVYWSVYKRTWMNVNEREEYKPIIIVKNFPEKNNKYKMYCKIYSLDCEEDMTCIIDESQIMKDGGFEIKYHLASNPSVIKNTKLLYKPSSSLYNSRSDKRWSDDKFEYVPFDNNPKQLSIAAPETPVSVQPGAAVQPLTAQQPDTAQQQPLTTQPEHLLFKDIKNFQAGTKFIREIIRCTNDENTKNQCSEECTVVSITNNKLTYSINSILEYRNTHNMPTNDKTLYERETELTLEANTGKARGTTGNQATFYIVPIVKGGRRNQRHTRAKRISSMHRRPRSAKGAPEQSSAK